MSPEQRATENDARGRSTLRAKHLCTAGAVTAAACGGTAVVSEIWFRRTFVDALKNGTIDTATTTSVETVTPAHRARLVAVESGGYKTASRVSFALYLVCIALIISAIAADMTARTKGTLGSEVLLATLPVFAVGWTVLAGLFCAKTGRWYTGYAIGVVSFVTLVTLSVAASDPTVGLAADPATEPAPP
jgi:hypothetical protein